MRPDRIYLNILVNYVVAEAIIRNMEPIPQEQLTHM